MKFTPSAPKHSAAHTRTSISSMRASVTKCCSRKVLSACSWSDASAAPCGGASAAPDALCARACETRRWKKTRCRHATLVTISCSASSRTSSPAASARNAGRPSRCMPPQRRQWPGLHENLL